mmetsp:Transcript_35112/g.111616  ORF Transcript_35112/g.111616 Transcript_35112/m.111616 type:complete len:168 (-) Transcript_35112:19-522(-)
MPPKGKKKLTNKPSPLDRMRVAFEAADADADGCVSREEFLKVMEGAGLAENVANQLFNRFDPDRSGKLDKEEFFAYAAKGGGELRSLVARGMQGDEDEAADRLVETFRKWDADGDGTISREELERIFMVLNPSFTKSELEKVWKAADLNGDGQIDYAEFVSWLRGAK